MDDDMSPGSVFAAFAVLVVLGVERRGVGFCEREWGSKVRFGGSFRRDG